MEDDKVAKRINDKRTSIQKTKELHERNAKVRAEVTSLTRSQYQAERNNPVVLDILAKAKSLVAAKTRVSQDGIGYRTAAGAKEPELIYLTSEKRLSELDKAAGMLEIIDYIERQFSNLPETPKSQPEEDLEAANDDDMVAPAV